MNVHESEKLAGILEELGYTATNQQQEADLIIFNTCAVRKTAEARAEGHIGYTKKFKNERVRGLFELKSKSNSKAESASTSNSKTESTSTSKSGTESASKSRDKSKSEPIIAVGGCITQLEKRAKEIAEKFPFVDIIFGTHNLIEFKRLLSEYEKARETSIQTGKPKKQIISITHETDENAEVPISRTSGVNAWVNIIYGCNNFCSFCIVPYVRGREKSRKPGDIVAEVEGLVAAGYKSVTLLGQNVNSYGAGLESFADSENQFANLLTRLNKIDGDFWIKFMTSHPKDFTSDVIDAIAKSEKVCKAIHLPIQSGSSKVLKDMNRPYTKENYLSLVAEIKQKIPGVTLTTDIIVGFPGESEQDFLDTLSVVEQVGFDNAFTYIYNKREGTAAALMDKQICPEVKKQRIQKLIETVNKTSAQKATALVGTTHKVLVEEVDKKSKPDKKGNATMLGSTYTNRFVSFTGNADDVGKFVNVKIVSVNGTRLQGVLV